jgi:glycosyltransferase involved in cell wall biosynthesis
VRVRLVIANGFTSGGTVRTTIGTANALADHHDVELVTVYRYRSKPLLPIDPRVTVRTLVDYSSMHKDMLELQKGPIGWARRTAYKGLISQRSRLIHKRDFRYPRFNALTDIALYRYLRSLNDGVVIGTRAGLNMVIARHTRPSVIRIGQEHLHYGVYGDAIRQSMRTLFPRLDAFVPLTERDAERWRLVIPDARIEAIPNAVPHTGDKVSPLNSKIVIAAGRLARQKGYDRLIPAWRIVADRHPDWQLHIYGGGKEKDNLLQQIKASRLTGSAHLMGVSRKMYDDMRTGSIFVMSSRFEGFPMVLLEAMSCGLPTVAFDFANGARELIQNGENGVLVGNRDIKALAEGLCEMIESPEKRAAYGAKAAETVRAYNSEVLAQRWTELFSELARTKQGASAAC